MTEILLPSWRPGTTCDAAVGFLDAVTEVAITEVGRREGWTVVSMRDDWETVFPAIEPP